jgi:hypothetical protein
MPEQRKMAAQPIGSNMIMKKEDVHPASGDSNM